MENSAATVVAEERFGFGENWNKYIQKNLSQERIDISKNYFLSFVKCKNIKGKTFLDIGCGSGLHSIGALQAGANQVDGFDYDPQSVEANRFIQKQMGHPQNWTVQQGDVLNDEFMSRFPKYDIVYSWGVLHHTGNVWKAMDNAASRVKSGGLFYIALYSADMYTPEQIQYWLDIKQKYVKSGSFMRTFMVWQYVWRHSLCRRLRNIPHFIKSVKKHKAGRGMSIFTDIRDWIGGWPMEFVADKDAIKFCEERGFKLENIKTGDACTEFLFVKS